MSNTRPRHLHYTHLISRPSQSLDVMSMGPMSTTTTTNHRVLVTASLAVLAAYFFHRINILQSLLITPLALCFLIVAIAVTIVTASVRADRVGTLSPTLVERQRRATRPLVFATDALWPEVLARKAAEEGSSSTRIRPTPIHRKLGARLDAILVLVRRSFIIPWYNRLSPSRAFPDAVDGIIRHAVEDFGRRADSVDWPTVVVSRILPLITDHVQYYRSIEQLLASSASVPALPFPLPRNVHPALAPQFHSSAEATSLAIESHLRDAVDRILGHILPLQDRTEVTSIIAREILLGSVMLPLFDMLCDSDFWNRQIDDKGGRYLHEQKQVNRFLSALSTLPQQSSSSPISKDPSSPVRHKRVPPPPSITVQSSTKQFDDFMRSIPKLKSLGEARRLRSDVERELRSARSSQAAAKIDESKDTERELRRAERYVHRLEKARTYIDRQITSLGARPHSMGLSPQSSVVLNDDNGQVNLYTILSDPSSLAYWLEYMERRGRSRLVQFWLTVEGFKDPLEASGQNLALDNANSDLSQGGNDSTIGEDIAFLHATYFSTSDQTLPVPSKLVAAIAELAAPQETPLTPSEIRRGKQAVFGSQKAVYEQMEEEDWSEFKKSELYLKALADLKSTVALLPPVPIRSQSLSPPASPDLLPLPPRQQMTPVPLIRRPSSPLNPRRPYLVNGSFTPASSVAPSTVVSMAMPSFDQPSIRKVTPDTVPRKVTPDSPLSPRAPTISTPRSLSTPRAPSTPPSVVQRRSSHLDFLIGGGVSIGGSENRGPLFNDEDEVLEDTEEYIQAQRMEAIQAALNEIIASDDLAPTRKTEEPRESPDLYSIQDPLSSSLILMGSEKHALERNKYTSRSVEDLQSPLSHQIGYPVSHPTSQQGTPTVTSKDNDNFRRMMAPRRASLDRIPTSTKKNIFADDSADEDEMGDVGNIDDEAHDVVQLAAPGDLQLSVEIARLVDKIQEFTKQDALLESLIRQAELTGNQKELKLLQRSQSSLRREQRTAIFQKAQFEQQEKENRLVPGRTRVTIPSSIITSEDSEGGRQVVRYTVEISQIDDDGRTMLSWVVARRYNEFWELDRAVRDWSLTADNLTLVDDLRLKITEIPGKRLVPNVSASFVEARRIGLEKYLQSLLSSGPICDSPHLRTFLSRSSVQIGTGAVTSPDFVSSASSLTNLAPRNIVKSLYKTMASSLDDALLGPSMLDLMSQSLSRQLSEVAGGIGGKVSEDLAGLMPNALKVGVSSAWATKAVPGTSAGASSSSSIILDAQQLPANMQPLGGESATGSFTAPICDLFIEVFDLKENNWLRRQAIVIILQQILGGTIERKFRDTFRNLTSADSVDRLLATFQDTLWPGGERRPPSVARTDAEREETRAGASKKLGLLIPDVAANMIGRGNARRAARRVFGVLQDRRLNQHLVLSILDEVFNALFPNP